MGRDYDLGDIVEIEDEKVKSLLKEFQNLPFLSADQKLIIDWGDHKEIVGTIKKENSFSGKNVFAMGKGKLIVASKSKEEMEKEKKEKEEKEKDWKTNFWQSKKIELI